LHGVELYSEIWLIIQQHVIIVLIKSYMTIASLTVIVTLIGKYADQNYYKVKNLCDTYQGDILTA
jgi:hypothetical protein